MPGKYAKYATPSAFKMGVEQRLRNDAAASGTAHNRRRQLFIFDRYLARLFSLFEDTVVLKGGLVIELRLELHIIGAPDLALPRLQEAGRIDLGDYLTFEIQPDPRHPEIEAEGMNYQGLRFRAIALLAGKIYGAPFGIDVAFAEPLHGVPEKVTGSRFLEFAGIEPATFQIYPLETHIAEKFHAYTLPRERPNSRVKDLPDLALLASVRNIDGATLRAAIDRTFEHRATHAVPEAVPAPPEAWLPVYERIAVADGLRWQKLDDVTNAVRTFLDPVLEGKARHWRPDDWTWS